MCLSILLKILFNTSLGTNPSNEAFLRILVIWNKRKGNTMVSLNQNVPGNPNSTLKSAVRSIIQKKRDLSTFNALKVLNPSRFDPAHIPKNPSTAKTDTTARYC